MRQDATVSPSHHRFLHQHVPVRPKRSVTCCVTILTQERWNLYSVSFQPHTVHCTAVLSCSAACRVKIDSCCGVLQNSSSVLKRKSRAPHCAHSSTVVSHVAFARAGCFCRWEKLRPRRLAGGRGKVNWILFLPLGVFHISSCQSRSLSAVPNTRLDSHADGVKRGFFAIHSYQPL